MTYTIWFETRGELVKARAHPTTLNGARKEVIRRGIHSAVIDFDGKGGSCHEVGCIFKSDKGYYMWNTSGEFREHSKKPIKFYRVYADGSLKK